MNDIISLIKQGESCQQLLLSLEESAFSICINIIKSKLKETIYKKKAFLKNIEEIKQLPYLINEINNLKEYFYKDKRTTILRLAIIMDSLRNIL